MVYDKTVMHKLSYGLYVVTTELDGRLNGQIADAVMQINAVPTQTVAVSLNNDNYTAELAKKSGKLAISVLSTAYQPELIKNFGMQSGREVDKFAAYPPLISPMGMPYYQGAGFCGWLEGKVIGTLPMGTHTIFVVEVENGEPGGAAEPLLYADYLNRKNRPQQDISADRPVGGKTVWRCKVCGYIHEGDMPEDYRCPVCGVGKDMFELV